MNSRKYAVKKGRAGEELAEYFFQLNGWVMFRTQPETRMVVIKGKPLLIHSSSGGIADYTGYKIFDGVPVYMAVEVKCHKLPTMPASVLSVKQREWMSKLPDNSAWVFISWDDNSFSFLPFIAKGSYSKIERKNSDNGK